MQTLQRQKGLTGIGWLFVLALIAGSALVMLRLLPVYMENMTISSVLDEVATSGESYSTSGRVRTAISRRFQVNNVDQVKSQDILISRNGPTYEVELDYEVRVPFVYNIDFVVSFENRAEVPAG